MVRSSVFVLVTLALLAGGFFAGRLLAGSKAVQAQSGPDPVSPASVDAVESFNCLNVANVAAYDNRIHVRCLTSPGDNVWFFA
jgi:threonine/homoserine efflux transporter RhtA